MGKIIRDPESAAKQSYDLIIIGGGIYGVMLSFEASRRGLKSLLLEKSDFGGATSFNSLRILHGGFRYLQTLDVKRFRESVAERKWFLTNFPELVKPLPCLMPLYGDGLRRPWILRLALQLNDRLSYHRNSGVPEGNCLPNGGILSAEQTKEIAPMVRSEDLCGGAVWYDAFMPDSQFILMEILKKACEYGCIALNYVRAQRIVNNNDIAQGIVSKDVENNRTYEFKSRMVINAAGPWCRELAADFDKDIPELFISSLAWNILFNKDAISNHALAVAPKKRQARTYFIVPWKDKLLAGTQHAPWHGKPDTPKPDSEMIIGFLNDLNLAIPNLKLCVDDILHMFSGLLPAVGPGSAQLTKREVLIDHSKSGGPNGLYSVSGVKFTTARRVAEKTLRKIFSEKKTAGIRNIENFSMTSKRRLSARVFDNKWTSELNDASWTDGLSEVIQNEAIVHLDDLIFRRSTLWENQRKSKTLCSEYASLFPWNKTQRNFEIERLKKIMSNP